LIFFLRVSLRRGSASRFGCASLHASKPRAQARPPFSSFPSPFCAARLCSSAPPPFTPPNPPTPAHPASHPLTLPAPPPHAARPGPPLRLASSSPLHPPALPSPLIFFLRVSLRRGSASRFGCASLHASKPRAYARRSFSSFASRFGAARQVASAAPRFTPRNP